MRKKYAKESNKIKKKKERKNERQKRNNDKKNETGDRSEGKITAKEKTKSESLRKLRLEKRNSSRLKGLEMPGWLKIWMVPFLKSNIKETNIESCGVK